MALREAGLRGHLARADARGTAWRSSRRARSPVEIRRGPAGRSGRHAQPLHRGRGHGVIVGCLYLPNGNPQPGPKFDYKLAWFERLIEHAQRLYEIEAAGRARGRLQRRADRLRHLQPEVVAQGCAAAAAEPRVRTGGCSTQGWVDAIRHLHPEERSTRSGTTSAITGSATRACASITCCSASQLAPRLVDAGVDRWVRGEKDASDHAPTWVELADG